MSAMQNFTVSRLPALQDDEIQLLQGSADFLGLNHYHTWMISRRDYPLNQVSFVADKGNFITATTRPNTDYNHQVLNNKATRLGKIQLSFLGDLQSC